VNACVLLRVATLRWLAVLIAVSYHIRFLLFADYGHLRHVSHPLQFFYFVTSLGHEAFVVYMVLSGLLLGELSYRRWQRPNADPWPALLRKLRALYLLLVPALLAGGVFDVVGSKAFAAAGIYDTLPQFAPSHLSHGTLAGNLLMLQDILVPGYGSNAMLFLLAYECWAYLILVAAMLGGRARVPGQMLACLMAVAIVGFAPQFLGYLLPWLAGFGVARIGASKRPRLPAWLGCGLLAAALAGSRFYGARLANMPEATVLTARVLLDWAVAFGLCAYLLSLYGARVRRKPAGWAKRLGRSLGRLSLPIYAVHYPFMLFVAAGANTLLGMPLHAQPSFAGFMRFALAIASIYLFALFMAWLVRLLAAVLDKPGALALPGAARGRAGRRTSA
jgi:peptidoglycan/LPS O-acetylase OafA/YrhL